MRNLSHVEIGNLKSQGCSAKNWEEVLIDPDLNLKNIINVRFERPVQIHAGVVLREIPGGIGGCEIKENVVIENVDSILFEPESAHGVGTMVAVLDETGSRPVPIYPGLSSQMAVLIAREPKWLKEIADTTIREFLDSRQTPASIGEGSIIRDCGIIKNVSIGNEIVIEGALRLENGSIINNSTNGRSLVRIGAGVEAYNFIVEDGRLESKCSLFNCYVGQGVEIGKGFTAHDSLFFANSNFENGEAVAVLAGPYSVSMHKGTLMIGCQTSFMNAGSSTNQSNHMYKLGPVHWGVMERGVKTASGSYLMLGAKIGSFSLLMGSHKTHPDSSSFPFSYLFGDDKGATVVVPGAMLRSCGLLRDEKKWPARDRRLKRKLPLFDRITFNVLNPFTVGSMLDAIGTIEELLSHPADDDLYVRYKGMKFTRASLDRARNLYTIAIFKYLSLTLPDGIIPEGDSKEPEEWIDLGGMIMTRSDLSRVLASTSVWEAEQILDEAYEDYQEKELQWIGRRFGEWWRERESRINEFAAKFDETVEEDRQEYLENLRREMKMLEL